MRKSEEQPNCPLLFNKIYSGLRGTSEKMAAVRRYQGTVGRKHSVTACNRMNVGAAGAAFDKGGNVEMPWRSNFTTDTLAK